MTEQQWQILGLQLGIAAGTIFVMAFAWMVSIKLRMRGRIFCYFLEPTNFLTGELLKVPEKDPVVTLTSRVDSMCYAIDVNKQRMVHYPACLPTFMQETVPFQAYVRGQMHPVDLRTVSNGHEPGNNAAILKSVKNVTFVAEMVDKLGTQLGTGKLTPYQLAVIIVLAVMGVALGGVGYLSYRTYQTMEILRAGIVGS